MARPAVVVHFTLEPDADPDEVQRHIEEHLSHIGDIRAQARQEQARLTGPEVASMAKDIGVVIGVGIVLIRQSREL
jgi:hypothetical protein